LLAFFVTIAAVLSAHRLCAYDNVAASASHTLQDGDDKLPVHYARSAEAKKMLLRATPQVEKAGIGSSFARFSVADAAKEGEY
jgi:hypothetical protein